MLTKMVILPERLKCSLNGCVIKELSRLLKYASTSEATQPSLCQVRDYLKTHPLHIQYRQLKKQGLPISSGMVESACKWLI